MSEQINKQPESWAIVELMGHVALAGRITKPGDYGGLWQVDVPMGDTFRTEFFGSQSVYRIRMVSEEIARAYAPHHEVIEYAAPIITREEHEAAMNRAQDMVNRTQYENEQLRRRLTAVNSLPPAIPDPDPVISDEDDWDDDEDIDQPDDDDDDWDDQEGEA